MGSPLGLVPQSFPKPDEVLPQMTLLDKEYPGMFRWMGEVNLVKQALFNNGQKLFRRRPLPLGSHSWNNYRSAIFPLPSILILAMTRSPKNTFL
jgi:hypothetical protein